METRNGSLGRRRFLQQCAALLVLAAQYPSEQLAQAREAAAARVHGARPEPWRTLAAVQEHLFPPGDDTPGASDIGAIDYLRNTLEQPGADGSDRGFIVDGVGWLNDLAREDHGAPFVDLDEAHRETLLRKVERSRAGERWLSLMLTFVLEALLADPVYGGNRDGRGWVWLEHQPGFPTPPAERAWYRLRAARRPAGKA